MRARPVPLKWELDHGARETGGNERRVLGGVPDAVGPHPLLAVLASALKGPAPHPRRSPMTTRLYYVWFLSVILAFILEFLTTRILALLSV
jgi:hypothetical protein